MKVIKMWIPMSTEVIEDQREAFKYHMGIYPEELMKLMGDEIRRNNAIS